MYAYTVQRSAAVTCGKRLGPRAPHIFIIHQRKVTSSCHVFDDDACYYYYCKQRRLVEALYTKHGNLQLKSRWINKYNDLRLEKSKVIVVTLRHK